MQKKLLVITILTVLAASVASECTYWYIMVPRLSQSLDAPNPWWIAVLLPFGLASLIIGWLIKTLRLVPLHSTIASVTAIVSRLAFLELTGRPPAHDAAWVDLLEPAELIWWVPGILIVALVFAIGICCGYGLRSFLLRTRTRAA